MGIFSTRKNKKFNYKPQYFEHDGDGSPFEIRHKFDDFRVTVGDNRGLKKKFVNAVSDYKTNKNKEANKRVFIIALILVFLFLLFINFDLSIFFKQ